MASRRAAVLARKGATCIASSTSRRAGPRTFSSSAAAKSGEIFGDNGLVALSRMRFYACLADNHVRLVYFIVFHFILPMDYDQQGVKRTGRGPCKKENWANNACCLRLWI